LSDKSNISTQFLDFLGFHWRTGAPCFSTGHTTARYFLDSQVSLAEQEKDRRKGRAKRNFTHGSHICDKITPEPTYPFTRSLFPPCLLQGCEFLCLHPSNPHTLTRSLFPPVYYKAVSFCVCTHQTHSLSHFHTFTSFPHVYYKAVSFCVCTLTDQSPVSLNLISSET